MIQIGSTENGKHGAGGDVEAVDRPTGRNVSSEKLVDGRNSCEE